MLGLGMALATLAVTSPQPALAQSAADVQATARSGDALWLPWLGCWKAEGAASDAGLLCVRPGSERNSVEVLRMDGTDVASREVVWADGQEHQTSRDGCSGWEKGTFSKDACEGGVVRTGGGLMTLVSPSEWLDVRYIGMGDEQTPWVQRYRLASQEQAQAAGMGDIVTNQDWSVRSARMSAANPPDVNDVIEASEVEPASVVQAWLAERRAPLKLNAKALERMADAGVDSSVIDMAVAVSYPDHFRVNTQGPSEATGDQYLTRPMSRYGYYDPFYDIYGFSPFGYSPYYSYSPYGYGYGYRGGYYGGYGYGYTPIITITNTNQTPVQHGRVIAGRGYTRGGYSGSGGGSASSAPARSSGSSGTATGRTGSSGSSSSTGRTAHRRGGGGGGL
jgi:hypothetical protein